MHLHLGSLLCVNTILQMCFEEYLKMKRKMKMKQLLVVLACGQPVSYNSVAFFFLLAALLYSHY